MAETVPEMRAETITTDAPEPEAGRSARRRNTLRRRQRVATAILILLALLNLGIGLAAWLGGGPATRLLYNGQTAAVGVVCLILAFFVVWRRSAPALGIAAALFAVNAVIEFRDAPQADRIAPAVLGVRLLLLVPLLQGVAALRALKRGSGDEGAPRS